MSFFPPIDHIQRRSSSFSYPQTYHEFMEYACHRRDELEVYLHMEENHIGIDEPEFWLVLLQNLKQRCQFKLLIQKLTRIKQIISLTVKPDFFKIICFEEMLVRQLQNQINRRKKNKRRSVREFQLFSISKLLKKTRKIGDGSFQIYVDSENRDKYKLNDLTEFILDEMKDYVNLQIQKYEEKRADRPWSFLGEREDGLKIWSKELIEANKRNSQFLPFSQLMNSRLSVQQRTAENRVSTGIPKRSNIVSENNPEKDIQKTPKINKKDKIEYEQNQLSIKKLMSSKRQYERQKQIFTTPVMKNPTIAKSVMKANGKNLRIKEEEFQSEVEQLQRELQLLSQTTDLDIDIMEYPGEKEVIRHQQNQGQRFKGNGQDQYGDYTETTNQQLDIARLDMSSSDECQQLEAKCLEPTVINFLQSTVTYESLDSNNENIFSNQKVPQNPQQTRNFRRRVNQLQSILTKDLQQRKDPSRSNSDLSISEIKKVENSSSEELSYQDFLDIDDGMHRFNLEDNQNLVLETMRKKKIDEIRESQKRKEFSHSNGIHTEMKLPTRLAHISEEHSYNSERKYTSRARMSSGIYKGEEQEKK